MPLKFKTFTDALTAPSAAPPVAANDNRTQRKKPEPRYRGTLPALRWLYDNHPDLAETMAKAVKSLSRTTWAIDSIDTDLEIRPTIGEIINAASDGKDDNGQPIWLKPKIEKDRDGNTSIRLGSLKFEAGEMVEYGRTRKGRKLEPRDKATPRGDAPSAKRNPHGYIFKLRGAVPSPLHAEPYQRPISDDAVLVPMYTPQRGVEAARAELKAHGVDGRVPFEDLPFPATMIPDAIAKGAEFLGGVAQPSGNSSSGAVMWEAPEVKTGEARKIVEEVASGATLKEIGERMGFQGARVDRMAKGALVDAARALVAANDNGKKKNAA